MTTINLGDWEVFDPSHQRKDKWQALKVLEEASELVSDAKLTINRSDACYAAMASHNTLAYDVADLLQTIVNLCAAFNITEDDLAGAHEECNLKNTERGMFGPGPRTHMHREEDNE